MTTFYVTPEYVNFIKNFIVNRCYIEYCKELYNKQQEGTNCKNFTELLIKYKNDVTIWRDILEDKLYIPMKYYKNLVNTMNYEIPQKEVIFPYKSFQEYIDTYVTLEKVGANDYQQFIKMMKSQDFKQKMVVKYNENLQQKALQNYIVHIVHLYIADKTSSTYIFTEEEEEEMDISLDMRPYFEYLEKNNWSLENIAVSDKLPHKELPEVYNEALEIETLRLIRTTILYDN